MSKKQQTLFQSWNNGGKQHTPKKFNNSVIDEVTLLDSDDDEGLGQAYEESLRNYYENEKPRQQAAQHSNKSSTSSYFPEAQTAAAVSSVVDPIDGFDHNSGNTWIYPTNKPVRKYQRDIVETCIFHNTLVTLPTGLGKTFIAAVVMYNFYRWYPQGKIIFLAPTKPLVAQQIQACYEIMGIPLECTSEMTGAMNPNDRKRQWKEKRVFFLTPQVLANDISRSTCPATEVKCLVLDEAHKAQGSFAYVSVVQELSKLKAVFRILALSATPGGDIKAIQQVISNLHISKIEVRDEDSPDIQPYTHLRNIEKVIVPLGPEITQVRDTFLTMLSKYVEWLKNLGVLTQAVASLTKGSVIVARERFRKNPPGNFAKTQTGKAEGDFAMCITLTHALELLVQHGLRGFYNFLAEKTSVPEKGNNRTRTELYKMAGFGDMMNDLASKFGAQVELGQAPVSHPKLTKLCEVVLEHFQRAEAEGRPTRVMIFSQFRDSVYEIVGLLEEYAPLVKAMKFVGHGNSSSGGKVKGFTQADQIRVIKEFTQGDYNTLVCTCVGEEGLDIGDVDMIICYDMHKSPVRLVQRCGRTGRKRDGRIVMLMAEGREEHTFNTSVYQKKNLVKVMNGSKLKEFLMTREPNLIPNHLTPRCHEMPMQVTEAFPVPVTKHAKVTANKAVSTAVRKTKITKCYYLLDTELEYYKNNLETDESVPRVPPWGKINTDDDPSTLKLDKFLPWQCNLQSRLNIEPSTLTSNYVEILQFIQERQDDLYGSYHEKQMTSFRETDQECEPPSFFENNDVEQPKRLSSSFGKAIVYPVTANQGLYSPTFLNLFNPISVQFDYPDIPTPPPSIFAFSPEKHRAIISQSPMNHSFDDDSQTRPMTPGKSPLLVTTKQQSELKVVKSVTNTSDEDMFQDSCNFDIDIDFHADNISIVVAKSPAKSGRQNEISETSFTVNSPVLSQRTNRAKLPLKRKLDMSDPDLVFTQDKRPKTELPVDSNPPCQSKTDGSATETDESILTVSQIVNLVSSPTIFFDHPSKQTIQPNFELEVDFIDSSQSEPETDQLPTIKWSQNEVKNQLKNSPAVDVPESPILSKRRSAAESFAQADFSLGFNLSDLRDEEEEEIKENKSGFKYAVDNAAWDECFALSASDLEDIDVAANAAVAPSESTTSTSTPSPFVVPRMDVKSRPSLPPAKKSPLWNSSGIRREIEDIFGGSQNVSEDSEILIVEPPKRPEPPMVLLDSDNDQDFIEATPPKAGNHTAARSMLESDDEPSPLVPRRLNPRRNAMLQTQSTPIVRKRTDRVKSMDELTKKKKSARAFIDEEAEQSLVDGSISDDEVLPQEDADQYEGSFVDDQASHNVSENMQAMYLRSVKSPPIQPNKFIFRQPAKPMNRSEIYSQAVVEEDENYMLDSFCVGSEEDDEETEHEGDHSESILLDETAITPVALRRGGRRRAPIRMEPARAENGRPRKRIISHPDFSSSDSDVATSPAKKLTVSAPKQETPPSPVIISKERAPPSSDRTTSFAALSKEERLKKQREKQEEFRRTLARQSSSSMVPMSDRAPTTSINVSVLSRNTSSTPSSSSFSSSSASSSTSPPVRLLISSRQMATVGPIISSLHVVYKCLTHVCSFDVADFVLSSQLGVVRRLHSDFTNGSNRCRLQEQLRHLVALYDKPFLVIEGDRAPRDSRTARGGDPSSVPDASSIIFKPNSPYYMQTCAALAQTELSVLYSESQEHTARLLNDLARQENLKGFSLPKTETLSPKQDEFLKFLQRIQVINPGVALLMATQFRTLREILNSSVETITERCKITVDKARNIVQAFRVSP